MSIICPYCSREFKGDKLNARHLPTVLRAVF